MTTTDITLATAPVAFDAAELKAALAKLKPVIPTGKWGDRTLQAVHVAFDGEYATLTATNIENTLSVRLKAPALDAGTFLVPFPRLAKVLAVYGKGTVTIESAPDSAPPQGPGSPEATVTIRFDRSTVQTTVPALSEYPEIPTLMTGRRVTLLAKGLADVLPAAGTDMARPILCSVLVDNGRYVATDSYRMHIVNTPTPTGEAFMLSRSAIELLTKATGDKPLEARVNHKHAQIKLDGGATLVTRLVDGSFPEYKRLVPDTDNVIAEFGPSFATDLKRLVKLAAASAGTPLKVTPAVSGGIQVSMTDDDDIASFICDGQMTLDRIGWNPFYLLPLIDGMSNLRFQGSDNLKPSVLRDDAPHIGEGCTRARLIMPVRNA